MISRMVDESDPKPFLTHCFLIFSIRYRLAPNSRAERVPKEYSNAKNPHRITSAFRGRFNRREIAKSQSISYGTVANYLRRAVSAGLTWPLPQSIGERELTAALFPERGTSGAQKRFAEPDFARVHLELKSHVQVSSLTHRSLLPYSVLQTIPLPVHRLHRKKPTGSMPMSKQQSSSADGRS